MRKKGLLEVMVWAVMSLYDGAKTRVRVGSAYSEEFKVKASRIYAVATIVCNSCGVIAENARRSVVNELLYTNNLVLMSEDMEDLKKRFCNWKDAFSDGFL